MPLAACPPVPSEMTASIKTRTRGLSDALTRTMMDFETVPSTPTTSGAEFDDAMRTRARISGRSRRDHRHACDAELGWAVNIMRGWRHSCRAEDSRRPHWRTSRQWHPAPPSSLRAHSCSLIGCTNSVALRRFSTSPHRRPIPPVPRRQPLRHKDRRAWRSRCSCRRP